MTPQEQEMLQGLIQRVNQTQLPEKDLDAEQMLQQTLGRNPDALYILAQTVLVQQYALDQAQKQLADLRAQQAQPKRTTSFLGNLLGQHDEPTRPAPPPSPQYAPQPQYTPVPGYSAPVAYAPSYGAPQGGGFLRSAAQTAAGVAAGALAFEGIESLMHGFGHAAGYGSGFGSFGESERPEIINNYYGDSASEHSGHLSPDIEDRRGESAFSQAIDNNDHGDSLMQTDNFDTDDTNSFADDSSNFDDSSDFGDSDSGGGDDSSF
jgi:hypothetical protein